MPNRLLAGARPATYSIDEVMAAARQAASEPVAAPPAAGRNRLLALAGPALAGDEAALAWAGGPVPQAATPTIRYPQNDRPGGTDPRTRSRVASGLLQRVARSPIPA